MELILLGSGTGIPSLTRSGPSTLIKVNGKNLLMDFGCGTLKQLLKIDLTYHDIDLILFSHLHPDHTAEFVSFLFACKSFENPRQSPLKIVVGKEFIPFFLKLKDCYGSWIVSDLFNISISEMENGKIDLYDFELFTTTVSHIEGSIAFRIKGSRQNKLTFKVLGFYKVWKIFVLKRRRNSELFRGF